MPWPLDTGAKLRNYHLARALAGSMSVTLLAFGEDAADDRLKEAYQHLVTVPRGENYSVGNMVRGAIGRTPLPLLNYTTRAMTTALERLLADQEFDVIQVESIHLMNYLPSLRTASNQPPIVCDWHNVESELMGQYAARERNAACRSYARRTARLMSAAERRALKEFDAHLAVSEVDAQKLLSIDLHAQVFVIENGVEAAYYAGDRQAAKNRIVFVGSMDYHANIEGVTNFAREVWPQLHQKRPDLQFTIVGRNPPASVTGLNAIAGIDVTGSVPDVRPYYREAVAAVVPLNVGGGSRLKILEAMAAGVPVVATRLGAEGLDVTESANIVLTEVIGDLADAILKVCGDGELRDRLILGGQTLVRERYDWSMLGGKLRERYQTLLAGRKRD